MIEANRTDCGTRTTTGVVSPALITRVSKESPLSQFTRFNLDQASAVSAQRKGGKDTNEEVQVRSLEPSLATAADANSHDVLIMNDGWHRRRSMVMVVSLSNA
jgi:hypothetical protein